MFTYSVPFEAAVAIWGLIFTDGMESLIVVGLGLLKLLRTSLLACKSDDEIRSVLEGIKEEMPFTGKDVIKSAIGMQVSADRMMDFRSAWMRDHPAEAAALAPVPFDCENIMNVPAATTAPAPLRLPPEAQAPPPSPPPPEPDLPAVLSDDARSHPAAISDDNLEDEGDAGFQPPGRQPSVPPSSKSDTATFPMDGFFDRPSSAPDGSGMLDYPELRKMTPPMLSPTVCDPQEMIIRTKADQAMLSVEGLPDWRSHLEGGIGDVAEEKPPSRENLDRRIPSLDPSVRRIPAMQETDEELSRRFSTSFGTSDSSPRRKLETDRSSPTRRRNTSSQYRLSTSVGPRSRGKRVTTTEDADEKKADDANMAFAESRARSDPL
jgi:hypothetical protein